MADAWNTATPTNANTVKDTVPDEFQALKVVNTTRLCTAAAGVNAFSGSAILSGGFYLGTHIPLWATVSTFDGTLAAGGGVWSLTRTGFYRVSVMLPAFGPASGTMFITVKSQGGGGDIDELTGTATGGADSITVSGVIELGAGRTGLTVLLAAVDLGAWSYNVASGYSIAQARFSVEYLRPN